MAHEPEMVDRYSVESAHARVDQHEAVCAIRWASIERQLTDLRAQLTSMSSRQWMAASTLLAMLLTGIAAMLILYIQHLGGTVR